MKKTPTKVYALILSLILIFSLQVAGAESVPPAPYEGYIIKLVTGTTIPFSQSGFKTLNTQENTLKPIWMNEGLYSADNTEDIILGVDPSLIEYIEPNYLLYLLEEPEGDPQEPKVATYKDPRVAVQWYLDAINTSAELSDTWNGTGVKVAVIDSGIYSAHEDLTEHITKKTLTGNNFVADEHVDNFSDDGGHGTKVAGVISAGRNEIGIAGLADKAELATLRSFSGKSGTIASVVNAIGYAVNNGADVINLSIGSASITAENSNAFSAAIKTAYDRGIIILAAVGNDGSESVFYPAAYSTVIGVGSVSLLDGNIVHSSFSQRNNTVYITAPGGNIISLGHTADTPYVTDSGTSFSTPMVSALAALVKQADKELDAEDFKALLKMTVTDLGAEGYDTSFGYGLINFDAMVRRLTTPFGISYNLDGGVIEEESYSKTYTINRSPEAVILLPIPVKEGFTFGGWYDNQEFSGSLLSESPQEAVALPKGLVGNVTYYAKWNIIPNSPPTVVEPAEHTGAATPASNDGLTVVVPYTADVAPWFSDPDVDDLTYSIVSTTATDPLSVSLNVSTLIYTPSVGDADKNISIVVKANDGNADSASATVTVAVGSIPADTPPPPPSSGGGTPTLIDAEGEDDELYLLDWENPFSDVIHDEWYYDAVRYVSASGLFNGTGDNTFSPASPMTRSMIVTVLSRHAVSLGIDISSPEGSSTPFEDVGNDMWYSEAVVWAASNGLIEGHSPTRFGTTRNITREQLATILYRYALLIELDVNDSADLSAFKDAGDISEYSYDAVSWAVSSGVITGKSGSLLDPKGEASRAEVAAMLMRLAEL